MADNFFSDHWLDSKDRPAGGVSTGRGFTIRWQNGPLGRDADRIEPNGAFVETILNVVADRIEFYQRGQFACVHNANALIAIYDALKHLDARTKDREERKVEGTHVQ